jgi:hypothetical protein
MIFSKVDKLIQAVGDFYSSGLVIESQSATFTMEEIVAGIQEINKFTTATNITSKDFYDSWIDLFKAFSLASKDKAFIFAISDIEKYKRKKELLKV